ncbi:MAG: NADPH-dependent F420 reductase [Terriglobia bacterium]
MKIGIIGTGNVGAGIGRGLAAKGHQVCFGVRDAAAAEVKELISSLGPGASAATVRGCAHFGDVIILAVPLEAAPAVVQSLGDLGGKPLVDCTNPVRKDLEGLQIGTTTSAAEEIARVAVNAKVIKCFNTTGAKNLAQTRYHKQPIDAYICGDDDLAKRAVAQLASDLGFEAVDCGPLKAARFTEPLAMLWIHLCVKQRMGPDIAFKLLKL